jgi:Zn-dependent protease/CBS domain-containing protein
MMGNTVRIGRLLGIEIRLDYSWFLVFFLVSWSLTSHYFPMAHPGWPSATYIVLGVLTAGLFFASVVVHELAHSVMSQAFGTPVRDITLFIFGGAARISQEPKRAWDELLMALAGPAASLALAGGFGLLWRLTEGTAPPVHAATGWLAWMNGMLGLFNLIPGFPLDGGRVFRAVVWRITGDLRQATRLASRLGRVVGFGFIYWGTLQILAGSWANGLWIIFIGWFLSSAAMRSYQQVATEEALSGHTVREAMITDCPRVPSLLTLDRLIDQVVLPTGQHRLLVVEDGALLGFLTLDRIKSVPRDRRHTTRVQDVMVPRAELEVVQTHDPLTTVLQRMADGDIDQLPVVDGGRLFGMIDRESLLTFIELQGESSSRRGTAHASSRGQAHGRPNR